MDLRRRWAQRGVPRYIRRALAQQTPIWEQGDTLAIYTYDAEVERAREYVVRSRLETGEVDDFVTDHTLGELVIADIGVDATISIGPSRVFVTSARLVPRDELGPGFSDGEMAGLRFHKWRTQRAGFES